MRQNRGLCSERTIATAATPACECPPLSIPCHLCQNSPDPPVPCSCPWNLAWRHWHHPGGGQLRPTRPRDGYHGIFPSSAPSCAFSASITPRYPPWEQGSQPTDGTFQDEGESLASMGGMRPSSQAPCQGSGGQRGNGPGLEYLRSRQTPEPEDAE